MTFQTKGGNNTAFPGHETQSEDTPVIIFPVRRGNIFISQTDDVIRLLRDNTKQVIEQFAGTVAIPGFIISRAG